MRSLHALPVKATAYCKHVGTALILHTLTLSTAFAQQFGADIPTIPGSADPGAGGVRVAIVKVINFVLTFLALVAVIFVIVGGFRILAAGGNEENVTK